MPMRRGFIILIIVSLAGVIAPSHLHGFSSRKSVYDDTQREYVIKPGDTLSISVWKQQDFDRKVTVSQNGRVSLPLVGEIHAAGLTLSAFKDRVAALLDRDYIVNPYVTVELEGKNVFIYGEVKTPGSYPLGAQTTVLKVITAAGGLTDFASSTVNIKRKYDNKEQTIRVDLRRITSHINEDVLLQPDDIIIVARRIF